jgi:hypothetical protein
MSILFVNMVNQENIYIKIKNKYANSAIYDINLSTNQILIIYDIKTNLTLKIIKNIEFKGENKNYELIQYTKEYYTPLDII